MAARAEHDAPTIHATTSPSVVETQLRFILDNVPQLIWSTRPDGHVDFYNRRWLEYVGASFEEMSGGGWLDFVHEDDRRSTRERWSQAVQGGTLYEVEYRLRRRDGEYRWVLTRGLPMHDASGRIVRWFGTCTDIHDQKKAERQREASLRELEQVTRLKDEFLASASHELRTPLNAILGWARMQSEHPELAPRATEVIERNAKTLADLINDLLDMSRIVVNKLSVEPRSVDVGPLVQSALDIIRPSAEAKRIVLCVEIATIGRIAGDANRLRQVVWNVLSNAVKFTPRAGTVTVTVERSEGEVHIVVSDTGKGIAADFMPFVFDRFRQADGSKTRREGGLGLGLAIAKHIVDLHGGTLTAESPGVGQGATFTISLPATAAVVRPNGALPPRVSAMRRLDDVHVLVVDDENDARELLTTILARSGATSDAADSVAAALDMLDARPPDIVLSDVGMPNQSGYDLACELRARGFTKPIVALTAFAGPGHRADALRAGFDDHLAKPVEPVRLVSVIGRLLDYWRGG